MNKNRERRLTNHRDNYRLTVVSKDKKKTNGLDISLLERSKEREMMKKHYWREQ